MSTRATARGQLVLGHDWWWPVAEGRVYVKGAQGGAFPRAPPRYPHRPTPRVPFQKPGFR